MGDDYKYLEYLVDLSEYEAHMKKEYYNLMMNKAKTAESEPDYDAQLDNIPLSKIEAYLRKKKLKNIESI